MPPVSFRPNILPGLGDAVAAALGAFAAGLFAVRYLDSRLLGTYALFFITFQLAVVVSWRLVFVPSEIRLLAVAQSMRSQGFRRTLSLGAPVALAAGALVMVAWIPTASTATVSELAPLAGTAWMAAWLKPIQDHIRRLQHLAGKSWIAVLMSSVFLVAAAVSIGFGLIAEVEPVWIPFGSLVIANTLSISTDSLSRIAEPCHRTSSGPWVIYCVRAVGFWRLAHSRPSQGSVRARS